MLEQFKSSLPAPLATYIYEKKVKTATAAAVLADEHVSMYDGGSVVSQVYREGQHRENYRLGLVSSQRLPISPLIGPEACSRDR